MDIIVITCLVSVGAITNYLHLRGLFSHSCACQKSDGPNPLFLVSQTEIKVGVR